MGYKAPNGRLRESGVIRVLELRSAGGDLRGAWTYERIAREVGVSLGTVYRICKGRTWKHIREEASAA